MDSYFRGYTAEERRAIKDKLRYYYDRFRTAVAKGRPLTMEQVDAAGRGQVFTGNQARQRKLVDQIGGLSEAIAEAKRRAGYDDDEPLQVVMLPAESSSLLDRILQMGGSDSEVRAVPFEDLLRRIPASLLVGRDVPQARLPFDLLFDP
jgi:protease-4